MARKKKSKKVPTHEFEIDASKLIPGKEKFVTQLMQFLDEQVAGAKTTKAGNLINVNVPTTFSKSMLKLRVNKFLYQSGLKTEYRLIALSKKDVSGFQIYTR